MKDTSEGDFYDYRMPDNLNYAEGLHSHFDLKHTSVPQGPAGPSKSLNCSNKLLQHDPLGVLICKDADKHITIPNATSTNKRKRSRKVSASESTHHVSRISPSIPRLRPHLFRGWKDQTACGRAKV